jgi:hypothetical protein
MKAPRAMQARRPLHRRTVENIFRDVEQLAEAAADTIEWLHRAGLAEVAQPLETALGKLGRTR